MLLLTWACVPAFIFLQIAGLTSIADGNRLTRLADGAMRKGQYAAAAQYYSQIDKEIGLKDDGFLANMGQAYMQLNDYGHATQAYTRLTLSKDAAMRSLAHAQLGVIASRQKNKGEAVVQTKEALRQDPNNQLARLNMVRLLKRDPKLEPPKSNQQQQNQQQKQEQDKNKDQKQGQPDQQQQDGQKPKDQDQQGPQQKKEGPDGEKRDSKDPKDQEAGNQDGKNNNKPQGKTEQGKEQNQQGAQGASNPQDSKNGPDNQGQKPKEQMQGEIATREQLEKMQMSEAQARQLLDAMRTSEVQYLQQRRRRQSAASKNGKPQW